MGGYKGVVLDQLHRANWKESLLTLGVEVKSEVPPGYADENVRIQEYPITLKVGVHEIRALEYFRNDTEEAGIVFFDRKKEDFELIDGIISLGIAHGIWTRP